MNKPLASALTVTSPSAGSPVPRYFFDIHDGDHFTPDHEGVELEGIEAAKTEAKNTLPDIVKDQMPDGDRRDFTVTVREESGQAVLRITLSLVAERFSKGSTANT